MEDGDDFYDVRANAIGDNKRSPAHNQLTGSRNSSSPAEVRILGQVVNSVTDALDHPCGC